MQIRPATEADTPRLLAIMNQTHVQPTTLTDFVAGLHRSASLGPHACLVLEHEGAIAGYGTLSLGAWLPPGGFYLGVRVDQERTGQGIGSALVRALEAKAVEFGGTLAEVGVRDHRPDWLAFAKRHGYVLKEHFANSILDLSTFDPDHFRPCVTKAEAAGYRFVAMADLPADEARRELYALDMECCVDEPDKGPDWTPVDYEVYAADTFAPDRFDPRATIIALRDDQWAGVSGCIFPPGRDAAWIYLTAVRRPHRGQGLAKAMKLLVSEYVKSRGDTQKIATGNHVANGPMLAVNRAFGFVPTPGSYILRKGF